MKAIAALLRAGRAEPRPPSILYKLRPMYVISHVDQPEMFWKAGLTGRGEWGSRTFAREYTEQERMSSATRLPSRGCWVRVEPKGARP